MTQANTEAASAASDSIVTNEFGGKQSHIEGAFHAIPPAAFEFLCDRLGGDSRIRALEFLGNVLDDREMIIGARLDWLLLSLERVYIAIYEAATGHKVHSAPENSQLAHTIYMAGLKAVAITRASGIIKYHFNNWRLIGYRSHLDHAIRHLVLHIEGDRSEEHLAHAATRIVFALEVRKSDPEAVIPFKATPVNITATISVAESTEPKPYEVHAEDMYIHRSFGKNRETVMRATYRKPPDGPLDIRVFEEEVRDLNEFAPEGARTNCRIPVAELVKEFNNHSHACAI